MSTRIRLQRGGRKKSPFYRIVVAEKSARRDGRFIERLGSYNPMTKEDNTVVDLERVKYWLSKGAQPSDRVRLILGANGLELAMKVGDKMALEASKKKVEEAGKAKAEAAKAAQKEAEAAAKAEAEAAKAAAAEAAAEEAPAEEAPAE